MDAEIAAYYNRRDAQRIAAHLDELDAQFRNDTPWYQTLVGSAVVNGPDQGQIVTIVHMLAVATNAAHPGSLYFDGAPADNDWDALVSNFRSEIAQRLNPEIPTPGPDVDAGVRVV